ncbi:hypothetical protein E5N71_03230 [Candidatus Nitrosocosmicus sp. SS]|jgi:hypothetical protein|nr:hypothetical protein E5N71_03230 [Candidatus Nitrosocosmicus sp. SS]
MRHDTLNRKRIYKYHMINEINSNTTTASFHSYRKKFSSTRTLEDVDGAIKHCVNCGNKATQEAIFSVEGATIIEKYCDSCSKKEFPITEP